MFITNDDLKLLIDIEDFWHNKLKQSNNENDEEYNMWLRYWGLVEKLCVQKDKTKKRNRISIAEKRKNNILYARSRTERDRIKRKIEKMFKEMQFNDLCDYLLDVGILDKNKYVYYMNLYYNDLQYYKDDFLANVIDKI